ncbi:putative dehydrogenase [Bacillus sp. TS-2]|nr:putative dehydrogenase [Bacillus sp. TS-2]
MKVKSSKRELPLNYLTILSTKERNYFYLKSFKGRNKKNIKKALNPYSLEGLKLFFSREQKSVIARKRYHLYG